MATWIHHLLAESSIFVQFSTILVLDELDIWSPKIWCRRRRNILRTFLESSSATLYISKLFSVFHAFLQPKRYTSSSDGKTHHFYWYTVLVTKRHKKLEILGHKILFRKIWIVSFPKPVWECFYDFYLWFYRNFKSSQNGRKIKGGITRRKKKKSSFLWEINFL